MAILTKEDFNTNQLPKSKVDTPEWGDENTFVYVRSLSGNHSDILENFENSSSSQSLVQWSILCVCDEEGNAIFDDSDKERLGNGPLAPLQRCFKEISKLNGLGDALEKNS